LNVVILIFSQFFFYQIVKFGIVSGMIGKHPIERERISYDWALTKIMHTLGAGQEKAVGQWLKVLF
jgi:hypothetical protein